VLLLCCSPSDSFSAAKIAPTFQHSSFLRKVRRPPTHGSPLNTNTLSHILTPCPACASHLTIFSSSQASSFSVRGTGGSEDQRGARVAAKTSLHTSRGLHRVPLRMSAGEEDESLQRLVDLPGRRYILVGGKGGVGKTSTSSAIAIKLADEGLKTLIISTDPAHSLGDALMTDLSSGNVTPISEQGDGSLYALEVDLVQAVAEFKRIIQGLKGDGEEDSISAKLGLGDLTDLFDVAPPGADELVALSKVISLVEEGQAKTAMGETILFDRVVIDTAPTGHTLRLLEYPGFLASLITKALSLRGKIDVPFDMVGQAGAFIASQLGIGKMPSKSDVEKGGKKLNQEAIKFRDRMEKFDQLLHDPERSEFVVVCIPTRLSTSETSRLVPDLLERGVGLRHLVVNQIVRSVDDTGAYLDRRRKEQKKVLEGLKLSLSQLQV
jgi:arsenite-transporting ATPase